MHPGSRTIVNHHESSGDSSSNYANIYKLLEKLCISIAGNATKELPEKTIREAALLFSSGPKTLTGVCKDEPLLVKEISEHLSAKSRGGASSAGVASGGSGNSSASSASLFLNLHQKLKTSHLDTRQRAALLTFLFSLSDTKYNGESSGGRYCRVTSMSSFGGLMPVASSTAVSYRATPNLRSNLLNTTSQSKIAKSNTRMGIFHDLFTKSSHGHVTNSASNTLVNGSTSSRSPTNMQLQKASGDTSTQQNAENLQNEILQNVIYSFTGIEGKYLKKNVVNGKFKLDPKASNLNVVQAGMLLRLSELGYYHDLVQSYADSKRGHCALGLMGQGFISALKRELTKYIGMVAVLKEQLMKQYDETITPGVYSNRLTLVKILVWSSEPQERLKWLSKIAEACQEKKGGALASTIYSFLSNGDPLVHNLAKELLLAVCGPLYQMLTRWLLEGEISDPHNEFFIECLKDVGHDRLWHDKYRVRTKMLPDFISSDMANKILVTGKSINFLCDICQDEQPIKGRDELCRCIEENAEQIFSIDADTKLHTTIDFIYRTTSERVLDIVIRQYKLIEHLQAMRRYMLLGQGDFINVLMEVLKSELDRPAKELYSYDLTTMMDNALRSTCAQYDDPDILMNLSVRLLTPCDGDVGWDILSLQYTVRGPLATILDTCMGVYQVLFKPLWRMKHMEFILISKWKEQFCYSKVLRRMKPELEKLFYRLHLFISEMIHFIHQVQYYILFEVIECSWARLQEGVKNAKALDDVLDAHNEFLDEVKCGAFLDKNSGELCGNLENVYEGIIRLETWQNKFYDVCLKELESRKLFEASVIASEEKGEFGVTGEKELLREEERRIYEQNVTSYQKNLENISADSEKAVRRFLLSLNSSSDTNLPLFGMRLDFNEYYKKRDQRLGVPLTFEHMRNSNIFFNSSNRSMLASRTSNLN